MPLNIDWGNNIIQITSPDTQVSGQVLHDFIEDQMAAPEGLLYNDILKPEGKIEDPTNPGIFSQIILVLSSIWQIQFWQGSGYTKIFGAKIVGGVSDQPMKATGAAGDITVMESPVDGVTVATEAIVPASDIALEVWQDNNEYAEGTKGHALEHVEYLEHTIFIDTELVPVTGNGTELSPYSDISDAIDFAEAHGFKKLALLAAITVDRKIKNFSLHGVGGVPAVDTNGQDIDKSTFFQVNMHGQYIGSIVARDCHFTSPGASATTLNGFFDNCAFCDRFLIPNGAIASVFNSNALVPTTFTKPEFDIGGIAGTAQLELMNYHGGTTIINCNQPTDNVKIVSIGIVQLDNTCTDGDIIIIGLVKPIDNSGPGCNVTWINIDPIKVQNISEVLGLNVGDPMIIGNGKFVSNNVDITVTDNNDGTYTLDRQ